MRTILLTPARSRGAANASDAPELRLRVVTKAGMSKSSSAGRDYPLAKQSFVMLGYLPMHADNPVKPAVFIQVLRLQNGVCSSFSRQ